MLSSHWHKKDENFWSFYSFKLIMFPQNDNKINISTGNTVPCITFHLLTEINK